MKPHSDYFKHNPPRCLDSFIAKSVDIENLEYDGHGEDINPVFGIECKCGNTNHKVDGFCWTNPDNGIAFFIGPLGLTCTKCNSHNEVFDIEQYGYDSELGHGCSSASGEGDHSSFTCDQCDGHTFHILARFEFTADLFDDDFLEARGREKDLFTWFSLHGICVDCANVTQICDYECA